MPQTSEQLSASAARHAEAWRWELARNDWLKALTLAPDSADIMLELSYVESFRGCYRAARDWVLRATRARPESGDAVLTLLRRLCNFNEGVLLRALAVRFLVTPQVPHVVLVECAKQLIILNEFGLAMQCAEAALARAPDDLSARLVRGQLHAHHGRIGDAISDFEQVLRRAPNLATAWWMLARLRKQTLDFNHIAQLRKWLDRPGLPATEIAAVARALHKELDDIGDYAAAWQALQAQCQAMRSALVYDPEEARKLVRALKAMPVGHAASAARPQGEKTPIFIVGMHRSGTTLLEQLLSASPQTRALGELYDFTAALRFTADSQCQFPLDLGLIERMQGADFVALGQRYLDGVAWRLGEESHFTDKQPVNFLNIGYICKALPHAKILHMVRDPMETCFSNLRELFSDANRHSYDQLELADYFLQYRSLMGHWHAAFPGRILDVGYAQLTSDPAETMRVVGQFCGVDYVDSMRSTKAAQRAVATASSIQVREEVAQRDTPKWLPYESQLQPLLQALRDGR